TGGREDGTATVWNIATRESVLSLNGRGGAITAVAFSADGSLLVTGDSNGVTRVWEAQSGRPVAVLRGDGEPVLSVAIAVDRGLVVTANRAGARVYLCEECLPVASLLRLANWSEDELTSRAG